MCTVSLWVTIWVTDPYIVHRNSSIQSSLLWWSSSFDCIIVSLCFCVENVFLRKLYSREVKVITVSSEFWSFPWQENGLSAIWYLADWQLSDDKVRRVSMANITNVYVVVFYYFKLSPNCNYDCKRKVNSRRQKSQHAIVNKGCTQAVIFYINQCNSQAGLLYNSNGGGMVGESHHPLPEPQLWSEWSNAHILLP